MPERGVAQPERIAARPATLRDAWIEVVDAHVAGASSACQTHVQHAQFFGEMCLLRGRISTRAVRLTRRFAIKVQVSLIASRRGFAWFMNNGESVAAWRP